MDLNQGPFRCERNALPTELCGLFWLRFYQKGACYTNNKDYNKNMVKKIFKAIFSFVLDFIQTIVTALSVFVIVYLFLVQPHQVKGSSMTTSFPNAFNNGDYILTNKVSYRFEKPKRGDVIIFRAPVNTNYDYIKRIIGLPGDRVKIYQNKVYINGFLLDESEYLTPNIKTTAGHFIKEGEEIVVPEDKYFVLGDNRSHSSDSREWGFISKEDIVGKAWFRYWPPNKIGLIKY